MEEAEQVLKLFDSFWFGRGIFMLKDRKFPAENIHKEAANIQYTRSFSDRYLGHKAIDRLIESDPEDLQRSSSLIKPQLQKILSGKEINEFFELVAHQERVENEEKQRKKKKYMEKTMKRSLSALEFEEVKGFMDLGFIFTEEDKTSSLASIIPGLKKWGSSSVVMADDNNIEQKQERVEVSRPYLSEAWNQYYMNKGNNNNWKIPYVHNENKMKNHLRAWAHTVASAVR